MLFRKGVRTYLAQEPPKREFRLLVDPECVHDLCSNAYSNILQLILDLSLATPSVKFVLLTAYQGVSREPLFTVLSEPVTPESYSPAHCSDDDPRRPLLDSDECKVALRTLCAFATDLKVDGIITTSAELIHARYALYQYDLINVIPLNEFADFVEICAHGHGIFWSAAYLNALTQDVYYTLAHHKGSRLANFFNSYRPKDSSIDVREDLRSLLLNRYPFILYARDMVRFFQIQKDSSTRWGRIQDFNIPLSYHVNVFYLLLWGMLDHFCLLANAIYRFGLKPRKCGINNPKFWDAVEQKDGRLNRFVKIATIADWIDIMSDFRHAAAHKIIPMPTAMAVHTEDSELPEVEILKIIKQENPRQLEYFDSIPDEKVRKAIEDFHIFQWRLSKVKKIADHVVLLEGKRGAYWRSPVLSIDHDLQMLTGVMDGFLVALFGSRVVTTQ